MGLDLRINDRLVAFKSQTLRIEDQWGERSDLRVTVDDYDRQFSFENFNHITLDERSDVGVADLFEQLQRDAGTRQPSDFVFDPIATPSFEIQIVGTNETPTGLGTSRLISQWLDTSTDQIFSLLMTSTGIFRFNVREVGGPSNFIDSTAAVALGEDFDLFVECDTVLNELRMTLNGFAETPVDFLGLIQDTASADNFVTAWNRLDDVDQGYAGRYESLEMRVLGGATLLSLDPSDLGTPPGEVAAGTLWLDAQGVEWTAGVGLDLLGSIPPDERIFEGFLQDANAVVVQLGDPDQRGWVWKLDAFDNVYRADKRVVVRGYENMTAGQIARSLVDGTGPGGPHPDPLGEEGVTVGDIDEEFGPVYPVVAVNYAKVSKVLDALADSARGIWNIDDNRALNFHPFDTVPGTSPDIEEVFTPASVASSNPRYRNQQIVRGGHDTTSEQVEQFESPANVDQTTWVTSYPFAQEPGVTLDGVPQTLGIRGLDQSGFDFYWNKNSNVLSADPATVIQPNDIIQVTYFGFYDALIRTNNPIEIDRQQDREDSPNSGTSGLVEDVEVTADYDDITQAIIIGATLLIAWSQTAGLVTFRTDLTGFKPGQVIDIPLPAPTQGMDPGEFTDPEGEARTVLTEFTVRTVETFDVNGLEIWFVVTAVRDAQVGTWRSFWTKTLDAFDEDQNLFINTTEIDIIIIVEAFAEDWTWGEDFDPDVFACPVPSENLFPSADSFVSTDPSGAPAQKMQSDFDGPTNLPGMSANGFSMRAVGTIERDAPHTEQDRIGGIFGTGNNQAFTMHRRASGVLRWNVRVNNAPLDIVSDNIWNAGDEFDMFGEYDPGADELRLTINGLVLPPTSLGGNTMDTGATVSFSTFARAQDQADTSFFGSLELVEIRDLDGTLRVRMYNGDAGFGAGALTPGTTWFDSVGNEWTVGDSFDVVLDTLFPC